MALSVEDFDTVAESEEILTRAAHQLGHAAAVTPSYKTEYSHGV
jgi:hypothetical protein